MIEAFENILLATNEDLDTLKILDDFITQNKEIEFFIGKFVDRQKSMSKAEMEILKKEREKMKQLEAQEA